MKKSQLIEEIRAIIREESDTIDTITVDVPLLIRLLEYAREDAKTDMDLHDVTENLIRMSKSKDVLSMVDYDAIVKKLSNESKLTENLNYVYKEDSGGGKPTMVLLLEPDAWEKVKHLFDGEGRPISDEIKKIPMPHWSWNLYAQSYQQGGKTMHKVYGVSGDYTFGNAPTYYQQKLRGNKNAAKIVFDWFIKKYLK
jgi:hypothetical protein